MGKEFKSGHVSILTRKYIWIVAVFFSYFNFSYPEQFHQQGHGWDWDGDTDPASAPRIKGDDEPNIVSWRVLEGVTEPFNSNVEQQVPAWKLMKMAADSKAKEMNIQQALHEYGQLLRHPYMFGEMPIEERYDVFLTMSGLLKLMGFHQRAELLLYEAMSYTSNPYEAHLQLGILFLDKEDLTKAKMHFKNCLFFKENDVLILVHLTVILISEGKMHEAKFFLSRILVTLEARVDKVSFLLSENERKAITSRIDSKLVSLWIEDLMVKVFYGEFRITPASTIDLFSFFSNMYQWLTDKELSGRFIFDLGQALYEGGRPKIGRMMMELGFETSDPGSEGFVSIEVVKMRLSLDYPMVPESLLEVVVSYLNMTKYLSDTAHSYTRIDVENVVDVYWPLPLMGWSGLPMQPVLREFMWRFDTNQFQRKDAVSQLWLRNASMPALEVTKKRSRCEKGQKGPVVKVGLLGGHLNNHPVGRAVLHRILQMSGSGKSRRKSDDTFDEVDVAVDTECGEDGLRRMISFTLLAFPLVVSAVTGLISTGADRVVNLPADSHQAWRLIESLHLDIVLFPDWQPFPDQQSVLFQSTRIAPVQICFFVRGTPCVGDKIDYYLLPIELQDSYLGAVPAAEAKATVQIIHSETPIHIRSNNSSANTTNSRSSRFNRSIRPAWMELLPDLQLLLIDWPVMTRSTIQAVAASSISEQQDKVFSPLDIEGQVFFDGQPVALLPVFPSQLHPLMDEVLFKIMRTVPALHLVLVLPDCYFTHTTDYKNKISWARKLVRRLWMKGGNLYHRIRLLPTLLNDDRLMQMLRQADMVLDTFPIGSSFYFHSLALSVGTPVITMASGARLSTPLHDLKEVRTHLLHYKQHLQGNPLSQYITHFDIPWLPCVSSISGFYESVGLSEFFVANSTAVYSELAANLALDREFSYGLRVRVLDAVDSKQDSVDEGVKFGSESLQKWEGQEDLYRALLSLGRPWAQQRDQEVQQQQQYQQQINQVKSKSNQPSKSQKLKKQSPNGFFSFLQL